MLPLECAERVFKTLLIRIIANSNQHVSHPVEHRTHSRHHPHQFHLRWRRGVGVSRLAVVPALARVVGHYPHHLLPHLLLPGRARIAERLGRCRERFSLHPTPPPLLRCGASHISGSFDGGDLLFQLLCAVVVLLGHRLGLGRFKRCHQQYCLLRHSQATVAIAITAFNLITSTATAIDTAAILIAATVNIALSVPVLFALPYQPVHTGREVALDLVHSFVCIQQPVLYRLGLHLILRLRPTHDCMLSLRECDDLLELRTAQLVVMSCHRVLVCAHVHNVKVVGIRGFVGGALGPIEEVERMPLQCEPVAEQIVHVAQQ
mmetsp:Transcript_56469/g.156110  ORF Transcript_56469/g.156110 Transcript_56469/m.156110 type:complete len:319 (+) Transcript_56469:2027-2983(+)